MTHIKSKIWTFSNFTILLLLLLGVYQYGLFSVSEPVHTFTLYLIMNLVVMALTLKEFEETPDPEFLLSMLPVIPIYCLLLAKHELEECIDSDEEDE